MRRRTVNDSYTVRMMPIDQAAAYIGQGITRTRQLLNDIGAKRSIGRRVVYDKHVIDTWLDSLATEEE